MSETTEVQPSPDPPGLDEVRSWVGFELDEVGGTRVGRVHGVFADSEDRHPTWLIVAAEHRRPLRRPMVSLVPVPVLDCAGAAGRVWTAHTLAALRTAPTVDAGRPLLREHELALAAHYGIAADAGRAAEVAGRAEGIVTSQPAY